MEKMRLNSITQRAEGENNAEKSQIYGDATEDAIGEFSYLQLPTLVSISYHVTSELMHLLIS